MTPNAEDMLVFASVAREGGVRRGAVALGIPRSTASRHLATLERAVSARLVSRTTRRFALTDAGRSLLEQCAKLEEVMKGVERVVAKTNREPSGTLRIATSPILGEEFFPEVLAEYLRRFPTMRVDVRVAVDFVDLRRGGIDLAVRTGPLQDASDLFATRLGASLKGHYVSPAYVRKHGTPKTPEDLAHHACIVIKSAGESSWTFRVHGRRVRVATSGPLEVDSHRLARSAATLGLGVARLPRVFAAPLVRTGELVSILEKFSDKMILFAVHAQGSPSPPKIRAFVDVLRVTLGKQLRD